jgi:hypothetical protein
MKIYAHRHDILPGPMLARPEIRISAALRLGKQSREWTSWGTKGLSPIFNTKRVELFDGGA